jgi:hypothetical protein
MQLPTTFDRTILGLIEETLRMVKTASLTFFKPSLARCHDPDMIGWYISFWQALARYLPEDQFKKISPDPCMVAMVRYEATGYGCDANYKECYVWPSCYSTGCPYYSGFVKVRSIPTLKEVAKHIQRGHHFWDFDRCQMPLAYQLGRKKIIDLIL